MQIDPRLNDIDDCLYRVAIRVLIVQNGKVLLIKENEDWWAIPGGGVEHGETVESALKRELEEELGVPPHNISSDFQVVHYAIGSVVNGIPRMNMYFKASVPEESLRKTEHVDDWTWFGQEDFMRSNLNPSYDKIKLAGIVF